MPPTGGESRPPKTRSSSELDPSFYQVLFEVGQMIDAKLADSRTRSLEDLKAALTPVHMRLDTMCERMGEGTEQFKAIDERFKEHSDTIENVQQILRERERECAIHKAALERRSKASGGTETKDKPTSGFRKAMTNIGLPLIVAILSGPLSIWAMLQLKMIAAADQTIQLPLHRPDSAPTPTPSSASTP